MRILIAEDDEALARFVRQGLEGEHYSVDVMPDGEQARTAATEFEYDVVILDLNLPKLDGVSVLRHLRSKKPSLPVLVLTPADSGGRPGPVPGHWRRRLSGQTILI
jgi:DNA-binding response OmpR family regulator